MSDFFLRKWLPQGANVRDIPPDIFIWDHVIDAIAKHDKNRGDMGLLIGSLRSNPGRQSDLVTIDDVILPGTSSGKNTESRESVLQGLLEDWRTNHSDKHILGWCRISAAPLSQNPFQDDDLVFHQENFEDPYDIALAIGLEGTTLELKFYKSDKGTFSTRQEHPFFELSSSQRATIHVRNMELSQPSLGLEGPAAAVQRTPPSKLLNRLGFPMLTVILGSIAIIIWSHWRRERFEKLPRGVNPWSPNKCF